MKRKITYVIFAIAAIVLLLSLTFAVQDQVKVTIGYNPSGTPEFKFKNRTDAREGRRRLQSEIRFGCG